MAIDCEVQSAVGNATLDPAHRTYSDFQAGFGAESPGGDQYLFPIQVQALAAIADYERLAYRMNARDASDSSSTWLAAPLAAPVSPVALPPSPNSRALSFDNSNTYYPALTPSDPQPAIHKLLGEAVIATMDRGSQAPWIGTLYGVDAVTYLRPGIIPWQYVLAILSLWTAILVSASSGPSSTGAGH